MKYKLALKKLKEGNKRVVNTTHKNNDYGIIINKKLVLFQKPFDVVLTCSDSRIGLSEIFDKKNHLEINLENNKNIDFLLYQIHHVLSENKKLSTKEIP